MTTLTRKEFEVLAKVEDSRCVSIFLPTHRNGREVLNHQDQLVFKNLLKQIGADLEKRGYSAKETAAFLSPAQLLLEDGGFWRNQSEGLAVFIATDFLRFYALPLTFEPEYQILHEFYLKPLLPVCMGNPEFYLLTLNFHAVNFYRGTKTGLREIFPENALPQRIEEVVGFDYRQKFLGFHAQGGGTPQTVFHGRGDGKDDKKDEVLAFFRAINKTVTDYLGAETAPLLVASLDYLFPLYEKVSTYPYLFPKHISGNPAYEQPDVLHQQALDLLTTEFEQEKVLKKDQFLQFHDTPRTSTDIQQIIPAAIGGQVETLFLAKDFETWGIYDNRDASVHLQETQNLSNTLLANLAAVAVLQNGGSVYVEAREGLPLPVSGINALYRYGG
ncbi:MAG: hypothetical protein KDD14_18245 [Saprospiraceae bacterium]|nr:hypothetical protein [Saprospiraceae bacterium]